MLILSSLKSYQTRCVQPLSRSENDHDNGVTGEVRRREVRVYPATTPVSADGHAKIGGRFGMGEGREGRRMSRKTMGILSPAWYLLTDAGVSVWTCVDGTEMIITISLLLRYGFGAKNRAATALRTPVTDTHARTYLTAWLWSRDSGDRVRTVTWVTTTGRRTEIWIHADGRWTRTRARGGRENERNCCSERADGRTVRRTRDARQRRRQTLTSERTQTLTRT